MTEKPDLTLKKMREALRLVNGYWPSAKERVHDNEFECDTSAEKLNYNAIDMIKKLGFDDVVINTREKGFNFVFIWKKEKKS